MYLCLGMLNISVSMSIYFSTSFQSDFLPIETTCFFFFLPCFKSTKQFFFTITVMFWCLISPAFFKEAWKTAQIHNIIDHVCGSVLPKQLQRWGTNILQAVAMWISALRRALMIRSSIWPMSTDKHREMYRNVFIFWTTIVFLSCNTTTCKSTEI